jgi:two-component system, OmpR family, response regulator VanR
MHVEKQVRVHGASPSNGRDGSNAGNPGASTRPAISMDRYSVLIVDDDASFVDAAAVFLGSHGYQAIKTCSGRQAIREVQEQPVDLAIIDLHLPDLSGVRVAQEVRRVRPSAVVIMISSDDSDEARHRCMDAGAWSFLAKPLLPRDLLSRINESLDVG